MSIQSILCVFGGSQQELGALDTAVGLTKAHNAKIRFLHISPDPSHYIGLYGEGVMTVSAVMDVVKKENESRLKAAKAYVVSYTSRHQIPLDAPDAPQHHPSARFIHETGMVDAIVAREGRLSDLIVIGRGVSESNPVYDPVIVTALFDTARPVLLLPARETVSHAPDYKVVVLAWNGGLEAARALYNALPFLKRAEKLYVMTVQGVGEAHNLEAESQLMEYLQSHGIRSNPILVAQAEHSVGEALHMRAKELGADLLVMGAYGHSRLREMVLGGLTDYMLEKAAIPLFLSH